MNFGRRDVLRAGALLLPLAAAVACTEPEQPPPPDPLAALAAPGPHRRRHGVGRGRGRARARRAGQGRRDGSRRARDRAAEGGGPGPPAGVVHQGRAAVEAPAPGGAAAARKSLLDALTSAEQAAATLVPTVERYRAGLVGSVAAGCASLREVLA